MSVAATNLKPIIEIDFYINLESVSNVQELSDSSISPKYKEFISTSISSTASALISEIY